MQERRILEQKVQELRKLEKELAQAMEEVRLFVFYHVPAGASNLLSGPLW